MDVLRAHQGRQVLERMQLGSGLYDADLVFSDSLGHPLNPMMLTRAFQSLAKREGIDKIRLHDYCAPPFMESVIYAARGLSEFHP